jgi:diaminopropionate ammonia-lyase
MMTNIQKTYHCDHIHNPEAASAGSYATSTGAVLPPDSFEHAFQEITGWPGYQITPLYTLDGLANGLGIASLQMKYEAPRFGLGSFKALGGAYAVSLFLREAINNKTNTDASTTDLLNGEFSAVTQMQTVCSATDGNHGRSVAWGAQMFGCRCVIYVPHHTSQGRIDAITKFGAQVIVHDGHYDDTVRYCAAQAEVNNWTVISDTSYEGYRDIPVNVMAGYTVLTREIKDQIGSSDKPTHVFVQGGVGGFATSVIAPLWHWWGEHRPRIIFVNPENVPAMYLSARAKRSQVVPGDLETVMACLSCGELSELAWTLLSRIVDDTITIPDQAAIDTMKLLAEGINGDPKIVAGESGCAGVAGLIASCNSPDLRTALGLNDQSRVLCICTEGATDPYLYEKIVGLNPDQVM